MKLILLLLLLTVFGCGNTNPPPPVQYANPYGEQPIPYYQYPSGYYYTGYYWWYYPVPERRHRG